MAIKIINTPIKNVTIKQVALLSVVYYVGKNLVVKPASTIIVNGIRDGLKK